MHQWKKGFDCNHVLSQITALAAACHALFNPVTPAATLIPRLPFRGGPELSQAARSAPEGLGLDRFGPLRDRSGQGKGASFSCVFLAARIAEDEGRALRGLWLRLRGDQVRRQARDRAGRRDFPREGDRGGDQGFHYARRFTEPGSVVHPEPPRGAARGLRPHQRGGVRPFPPLGIPCWLGSGRGGVQRRGGPAGGAGRRAFSFLPEAI
jgi:hypothetical protein